MTDIKEASSLIQKTQLFSALSFEEIDFIASHSSTLALRKNSFLFSPGEDVKHFFILIEGSVRVFSRNENGIENDIAVFKAGDVIGDFDFARGVKFDAYAIAAEDSMLIEFPASGITLDSLAQKEPQIVCNILFGAIQMMSERIMSTRRLFLENVSWIQELLRRSYEEPATGLLKQAYINDEIAGKLEKPSALIMLKPDRFKILVDSRGHGPGDKAMADIALILKNTARKYEQGWALRFKSNETGIIINNCDAEIAEKTAQELSENIRSMEAVPAAGDMPEFKFSASISWAVWPADDPEWESLLQGNYASLLKAWHDGGERIVHYRKEK